VGKHDKKKKGGARRAGAITREKREGWKKVEDNAVFTLGKREKGRGNMTARATLSEKGNGGEIRPPHVGKNDLINIQGEYRSSGGEVAW